MTATATQKGEIRGETTQEQTTHPAMKALADGFYLARRDQQTDYADLDKFEQLLYQENSEKRSVLIVTNDLRSPLNFLLRNRKLSGTACFITGCIDGYEPGEINSLANAGYTFFELRVGTNTTTLIFHQGSYKKMRVYEWNQSILKTRS